MADNQADPKALADLNLTDKELRHLAAGFLAHKDPENFDINVFTAITGHPNTTNARKRFGEIKKRVRELVFGPGAGLTPVKTTDAKAKATPRKRKAENNPDATPSSAPKRAAKRAIKAVPAPVASQEGRDDDGTASKKVPDDSNKVGAAKLEKVEDDEDDEI